MKHILMLYAIFFALCICSRFHGGVVADDDCDMQLWDDDSEYIEDCPMLREIYQALEKRYELDGIRCAIVEELTKANCPKDYYSDKKREVKATINFVQAQIEILGMFNKMKDTLLINGVVNHMCQECGKTQVDWLYRILSLVEPSIQLESTRISRLVEGIQRSRFPFSDAELEEIERMSNSHPEGLNIPDPKGLNIPALSATNPSQIPVPNERTKHIENY